MYYDFSQKWGGDGVYLVFSGLTMFFDSSPRFKSERKEVDFPI